MATFSPTAPFETTFPYYLLSIPLSSFSQHGNTYPDAERYHQEFEEEAKRERLRIQGSEEERRDSERKTPKSSGAESLEDQIIPLPPGMPDDINLPVGDDILVNTGIIVTDKPLFHTATYLSIGVTGKTWAGS
ncbi:hypothetical protein BLNAU_14275 [Blattamonas nauphoetae]|uniref:Uncharacterized protein n=1 Tax=Blattamonas nauphoetae TaxID=2049346 RepID=A0ABQ9XFM2_9EUKA|nr:hypothetical protein BLNAU_14275 [Blattamonas nauphoetae]